MLDLSKSPRDTKGPVVKTGPTKGQNRSRNDDGQWRAKRSDAGKTKDKSDNSSSGKSKRGCFLTTAVCEYRGLSDNCYELELMRQFRDDVLMKTVDGRSLIDEYYDIAPDLVPLVSNAETADLVWRGILSTIFYIEQHQHADAVMCYKEMVGKLKVKALA